MKTLGKILLASALLSVSCLMAPAYASAEIRLVPNPVSVEYSGKGVKLNSQTRKPKLKTRIDSSLAEEEYILDSRKGKVLITAGGEAGIHWGKETLRQILVQCGNHIPGLLIHDRPAFAYRGSLLDCSRHFFSVDEVKRYIDILSLHKLNVLHWHLTDDQGWRLEIKKYPRLTEVGAWRMSGGKRYGGYYTREDVMEIVRYAGEHHITVIPEIELPGHSMAALTAYPELGCTGDGYEVEEKWGIFQDILCAGKERTMHFLFDVLDEVCELFPSTYIHIGGDEAPKTKWKECPDCQKKMREEGIETEDGLQGYLVRKVEEYLNAKGRKIIGWDEILSCGVTPTATVMSWRGTEGGIEAAKKGNDVIMSPHTYFYLDYYQTRQHTVYESEGTAYHSYLPLSKCYSFNPYESLDSKQSEYIKGIQANVWTEYITNFKGVEQKSLPRLAALSEVAWNHKGRTSYEDFVERCRTALLPIYELEGYDYADFVFRNPPIK